MTTAAGVPLADNENSLTAGPRGPAKGADISSRTCAMLFSRVGNKCDHRAGNADHARAGVLFRLIEAGARGRLIAAIAGDAGSAPTKPVAPDPLHGLALFRGSRLSPCPASEGA